MSVYKYDRIVTQARHIKASVEKDYKISGTRKWVYYIAKAIVNPNKDVKKIDFDLAQKSDGDYISRDVYKSSYIDMANRLIKYVEKNKQLPTNISFKTKSNKTYRVACDLYIYMFAKILVYYADHKQMPKYCNISSKVFKEKTETSNAVFNYFVQVFGNISCIDDALDKISGRSYGYYYDDVYSNRQSIDRMKNRQGVNCTDSCHVFYNICLGFIQRGVYKKVECIHVKCRGGDGHVRLRITNKDGQVFYRDPACTLDNGGYCNWCMDGTVLAVNPSWFMANLNR